MDTYQESNSSHVLRPFNLPVRTLQDYSRLTFQHHLLRTAFGGNFLAPCTHPLSILDVVCGSGAWTADVAKLFPKSEIAGLDRVGPICPQAPSFRFIEGHTPSSLPIDDAQFDYVHQRCLGTVIPIGYWSSIANEFARVTRLGGWVELAEYGSFVNAGPCTQQFWAFWQSAKAKQGIDLMATERLKELLRNAGLIHVEQKTISISLHGGRTGDAMRKNLLTMIHMAKASILALGMSNSDWILLTSSLVDEWLEHKTVYQFHVAYGQRPGVPFRVSLGPNNAQTKNLFHARSVALVL
jgi:ubiquinone/menaquinone biosynthesis C-methylase UbiE